jgi:hypothetical protein
MEDNKKRGEYQTTLKTTFLIFSIIFAEALYDNVVEYQYILIKRLKPLLVGVNDILSTIIGLFLAIHYLFL